MSLLEARDDIARNGAWAAFLQEYSDILIKTARRASFDHDGAMDHYAFMLDQLRQDGCHRLRAYDGDGRGKFTTWLVVVARRLCIDHHRHTHGRAQDQGESSAQSLERTVRQNLVDLVADEIDAEQLADAASLGPDASVLAEERRRALKDAIGSLDVADQLLLTLRFEDDVPIERIGPMVGLRNRFQVHRRLRVVLAKVQGILEDHGFPD